MKSSRRGFSLIEVMVVVVIVGVAGSLGVQSLATSVRGARARSERTAVVLAVKQEKLRSQERMQGLAVRADGLALRFHRAQITRNAAGVRTGCIVGAEVGIERYTALDLSIVGGTELCLDEDGRPLDETVKIDVGADVDGNGTIITAERGTLAFSLAGTAGATGGLISPLVGAVGTTTDAAVNLVNTVSDTTKTPLLPALPLPLPLPFGG